MANNNVVIGVARDEKVKDYCIENRGSFFRQFILVSNGVLPSTSPAERTTVITAPQMVDCMILVMQTKRARSIRDKEPYLGWYSKKINICCHLLMLKLRRQLPYQISSCGRWSTSISVWPASRMNVPLSVSVTSVPVLLLVALKKLRPSAFKLSRIVQSAT